MGFRRRSEEGVKKGIRKVISEPVTRGEKRRMGKGARKQRGKEHGQH